jgi:hypothetical protein
VKNEICCSQLSKYFKKHMAFKEADQFPRWCHNRRRLSMSSVLKCPDLRLQRSVSFVHGLEKTHHTRIMSFLGNWSCGPTVFMRSELLVAHEKLGQFLLLTVYVVPL